MFDFSNIQLKDMAIHKVGNKHDNEGIVIAENLYEFDDADLEALVLKYLLSSFKKDTFFRFFHETDIHLNEVYNYVTKIFFDRRNFYEQSVNVLKHLYECSTHPNIKSGEFYMTYFTDVIFEGQTVDAIGIFKTENKDVYLKITQRRKDFDVDWEHGINVKKLDKGCLIFNLDSQYGYRVCIVDTVNKNDDEAQFWKDEFLNLTELHDDNFNTKTYLSLCQDYCENIYAPLHQADKKEQVQFLNNALNYFSTNEQFDLDHFASEVLREPEYIEDFKSYKEGFEEANEMESQEQFAISAPAVNKMKRKFKSLIKLDTEIEIKINNVPEIDNTQFIERGFDEEKGMKYYKIYFNEEE